MIASAIGATFVEEQGQFGLKIGERVVLPAIFDTRPALNLVGDELVASARHACIPDQPNVISVSLEDSLNVYRRCGFTINQPTHRTGLRYQNISYLGDGLYLTEALGFFRTDPATYGLLKDGREILPPKSSMIDATTLASGETIIFSYHFLERAELDPENEGRNKVRPVQVQVFRPSGECIVSFTKMTDHPIRTEGNSLFYRDLSNQEIRISF